MTEDQINLLKKYLGSNDAMDYLKKEITEKMETDDPVGNSFPGPFRVIWRECRNGRI